MTDRIQGEEIIQDFATTMKDRRILKAFGTRVKALRKQKEWTQMELAEKIGIRFPQLNKYECGLQAPPFDKLIMLSEALGTTVDFLLTGELTDTQLLHNFRLLERFRALESFRNNDQESIITLIDALIVKQRVEGALKPLR